MRVKIPATLSGKGTSGTLTLDVPPAATLRLVLDEIERKIPGAVAKIVDGQGRPHRYVNLYVNGDDVRHGAGLDTPVGDTDEVLILPAISGG
jgi:molybdopterin converting factor small subunit